MILRGNASRGKRIPTDWTGNRARQDQLAAVWTSDQRVYSETAMRTGLGFVADPLIALRTRYENETPPLGSGTLGRSAHLPAPDPREITYRQTKNAMVTTVSTIPDTDGLR